MPVDVRLAELIASLSLATDLGLGLPQEHVLRQTVIADRLAAAAGLGDDARADTFYVSLLAWVGCISDSHELAHWFGDDRQLRADSYEVDKAGAAMVRLMFTHLGGEAAPIRRVMTIGRFLAGGFRDAQNSFVTHCSTTGDIAERLGLSPRVRGALAQSFERWDGRGVPGLASGAAIEPVMRVVQLADDAEVHLRRGAEAVLDMLRARRGTEFDPALVDVCLADSDRIFGGLDAVDAWSTVIDGCAALDRRIGDDELDAVLEVFADYADLKAPWYLGHSRAVARLAAAAAEQAGLAESDVVLVRRAGLVHRLGATGVSTGIWNKATPLTPAEQERVRQVPYFTERVLARSPALAAIGALAAAVFERMDGSGYPRGLAGSALPPVARLLIAAAAYQDLAEDRPGRPALPSAARRAAILREVAAGRLDEPAVHVVLVAAGHRVVRRRQAVAGLTQREIEVLAQLVRGRSNKQIATRLHITRRTVASHIEHIFGKTGVTTRGAAAMFALRHGLVDPGADPSDE